jgi:hypothetical protein
MKTGSVIHNKLDLDISILVPQETIVIINEEGMFGMEDEVERYVNIKD